MRWLIILGIIVTLFLSIRFFLERGGVEPFLVEPIVVFEPTGISNIGNDFWSGKGRYHFAYLNRNKPIAYYYSMGLYVAYDARCEADTSNRPTVYVYDMWKVDKGRGKAKQVYPFIERIDEWETLKELFESGKGKVMPDYLPRYPTDEIMEQIYNHIGTAGSGLNGTSVSGPSLQVDAEGLPEIRQIGLGRRFPEKKAKGSVP